MRSFRQLENFFTSHPESVERILTDLISEYKKQKHYDPRNYPNHPRNLIDAMFPPELFDGQFGISQSAERFDDFLRTQSPQLPINLEYFFQFIDLPNRQAFWYRLLETYKDADPEKFSEFLSVSKDFFNDQNLSLEIIAEKLYTNNIPYFNVVLSFLGMTTLAGSHFERTVGRVAEHVGSYDAASTLAKVIALMEQKQSNHPGVVQSPEQLLERILFVLRPQPSSTGQPKSFFFGLLQGERGVNNPSASSAFVGKRQDRVKCPAEILTNQIFLSWYKILSEMNNQQRQELFARWQTVQK